MAQHKISIHLRATLPIEFPKKPPYENVRDYLQSKNHLERLRYFRNYEWDKPGHDPEFHLTAARRIFEHTKNSLEKRREWYKNEHLKLKAQWADLYEKELKFKDTFTKLSQFIRSNEEKRERASKICKEDYKLRMERTAEIERLQNNMDKAGEMKKEMDANILKMKLYEQYLNQVVSTSNDFKNADDIISRYEALVNTRNVLGKRQNENLRELEMARTKITKLAEENSFKILGLNNMVADLNSRFSSASRNTLHWETLVLEIKRHSYERYQELNQVKQSCWNIYMLMCKRKGEAPKIAEDDFEKQLIYIKKTLQELETVKAMTKDVKEGSQTRWHGRQR